MDCWHKIQCILFAHIIHTICRLTAYFACIPITNLEHLHQLVVGPERPAVDKLLAVEVLVSDVEKRLSLAVAHVYDHSLHNICLISAQVCTSVHTVCIIHLMHTW